MNKIICSNSHNNSVNGNEARIVRCKASSVKNAKRITLDETSNVTINRLTTFEWVYNIWYNPRMRKESLGKKDSIASSRFNQGLATSGLWSSANCQKITCQNKPQPVIPPFAYRKSGERKAESGKRNFFGGNNV